MSTHTITKPTTNTNKRGGRRAQAPTTNAKTRLCKAYERNGKCAYGDRCTFAHGVAELESRKPHKIAEPCWYFNRGGCSKSDEECVYEHVDAPNMRKPVHLQHPCRLFHTTTPGECRRGRQCGGDHDYELTAEEWKHHFKGVPYPGEGYVERIRSREPEPEPTVTPLPEAASTVAFPVLVSSATNKPAPTVAGGSWGKPLTVNVTTAPVVTNHVVLATKPVENWADEEDSEDLLPQLPASISNASKLQEQMEQLREQNDLLTRLLTSGKLPGMDGDLKVLLSTALREMLEVLEK